MVILQLEEQPPLIQAIFSGETEEVKLILENTNVNKQDVNDLDIEKRGSLHAAAFKGDAQLAALLLSHGARVNAKDSKWLTPLHRACFIGSEDTVAVLLNYQADTSARDRFWQTPLHVAASNGAVECVAQLLNLVPNPNVSDRSGRTALHHAAFNRHNDIIELLLSKGCIINACDKKDCRPLHWAAHMGHVDTIELMLRYGADVNARDRNQYTPLHVAAACGMVSACRLLLKNDALVDSQNAYGNTPMHIACLNGNLAICPELYANGSDIEAVNYRGQTPLHIAAASTHGATCLNFLLDQKININRQSNDGRTPLHMSAIHGRFTRSKILIRKGAFVDAEDKNGCTALHIAAQYGHELLSSTLLSFGADPSKRGYEGRTPLHMCCLSGYVECCRKFLQASVDLNSQDNSGKTPIHYAAYKGSVECLDLLVSNGANFQLADSIGRIPLHYSAAHGHFNCVFTLVGIGSNVNLPDKEGCTALHLAACYDIEGKCIDYLLQHKADPKIKDKKGFSPIHYSVAGGNYTALAYLLKAVGNNYHLYDGDMPAITPLHIAAKNGNQDILKMLVPLFLDVNIKDDNGCTPLLLAAREGHTPCVQMLLRYGAKVAICDNVYNMSPIHHSAKNGHLHCLALLVDNTEDKNAIDMPDSLQRTALMLAVSSGHSDCVITLLKSDADPNIVDADLHSPIFRAVVTGQNSVVQLLISKGADVEKADIHGKTVLHLAAACGHFACLQTILNVMSENAAVKFDKQNCTALHWAAYNGNQNCVEYLLQKCVYKKLDGNAFSPVHCASFSGFEKCLDLLCKHYGSEIVKLKDVRNRTPLHVASLRGHTECAKYLLKQGAEINCQDDEGRTPLLSAASNGQTQVIELLISNKADITSYDKNGNTSLHLACLKRHNHAALLLLEYIDDADIINMINNDRRTPLHLSARNGLVDVTRQLITKGSSVVAVDANGMTPALSCAPNVDVAQCLAIILANYPKQSGFNVNMLAKGIPELFYLSLFPKQSPKSKTEILTENPKRFKLIPSITNSFKDERERSDMRLSKFDAMFQELKTDCVDSTYIPELNQPEVTCYNLFTKKTKPCSKNSKSEISQIFQNKKENFQQDPECFIIENFTHIDCVKTEEDEDKSGFDLHHSSTSMALTKHKIYSDDDYKEIVRNTYQDSKAQAKPNSMKPFPRRNTDTCATKNDESSNTLIVLNKESVVDPIGGSRCEGKQKGNSKGLKKCQIVDQKHKSASLTSCGECKKLKLSENGCEGSDSDEDCTLPATVNKTSDSSIKRNQKFRTTRKYSDIRYKLQLKKSEASTEIKPSCIYTEVVEEVERRKVKPKHINRSVKSGDSIVVIYDIGDRNSTPRLEKTEHGFKIIETYSTDSIANVEEVIQTLNESRTNADNAKDVCLKKIVEERETIARLIKNEDFQKKIDVESIKIECDELEIIKDVDSSTSGSIDSIEDILGENILYSSRSLDQFTYSEESERSLDVGEEVLFKNGQSIISICSDDVIEEIQNTSSENKTKKTENCEKTCYIGNMNDYFVDCDEASSSKKYEFDFGGDKEFNVNLMRFDSNFKFPFKTEENYFSNLFLRSYLPAHSDESGFLSPNFCHPVFTDANPQNREVHDEVKSVEDVQLPSKNVVCRKKVTKTNDLVAKTNASSFFDDCVQVNKRTTLNILESQKFDFVPNLCEQNSKHLQEMRSFSPATNCRERKTLTKPFFLNRTEFQASVRELYLGDKTNKILTIPENNDLIPDDVPYTKIKLRIIDSTELFQTSWKTETKTIKNPSKAVSTKKNVSKTEIVPKKVLKKIEYKKLPNSNHDLPSFCVVEGLNKTKNFSNKSLRVTKRLVVPSEANNSSPPDANTFLDEEKQIKEKSNACEIHSQETIAADVVVDQKNMKRDVNKETVEDIEKSAVEISNHLSEDSLDCPTESDDDASSLTEGFDDEREHQNNNQLTVELPDTIGEETNELLVVSEYVKNDEEKTSVKDDDIKTESVAPSSEKMTEPSEQSEIKNDKKKVSFEILNKDIKTESDVDELLVIEAETKETHVIPKDVIDNILTNIEKEQTEEISSETPLTIETNTVVKQNLELNSNVDKTIENISELPHSSETKTKEQCKETEEKLENIKMKKKRSRSNKRKDKNANVELSDEENENSDDHKCFSVKNRKKNRDTCTIS